MKKLKFLLLALVAMICVGVSAKTDVTSTYLKNGNLSSLEGWTILDNFYTDWETDGDVAAIEFYSAWSSNPGTPWGQTKDFDFSQSPTLPAGYYRLCVNAFYREGNGNGTNTKAYIYAGDKQQYVVGLSSAGVGTYTGSNDLHKAANAFFLGEFSNEFDFQVTEENANQPLKIGFHGVFNTWCSWCCLGPVTIYEYTVDDYMDSYDEIVAKAELLYDSKMNKTVFANLKEAAGKKSSLTTIDELLEACDDLKEAISEAEASIEMYVKAAALIESIGTNLSKDGQDELADYIGSYNDGTLADYDSFYAAYVTAFKKYPADGSDMTSLIVNPQIDGSTGWTCDRPNGGNGPLLNGSSFEYWIGTAANGSFDYYQVINGLPNGHYNIGVQMYNSSNSVAGDAPNGNAGLYGYANNTLKFIGCTKDEETLSTYTLEDVVVTDGTLRLGVKNNGKMGARWFVADNFTLTFVSGMTETDAALIALNTILDQAKPLIEADAVATASLKEKIAADYATYSAYTSSTDIDVIKAATIDMTEQIPALNASIAAYANLKAAYEPYEGNTEVETLYNAAKGVYDTAEKTTDEVLAYITEFTRGVAIATLGSPYTGNEVKAGTFYLYNLASGKFLNGGNDWGTQMSLAQGGQPMIIAKSGDGYTIDSQISNGGNSHFVGNGGYLDAAATPFIFTNIGNNVYTISWADGAKMYGYDGSTTVVATQTIESVGSYWQLVSADDIKAAAIANGTKVKPFDVTSLIADNNFGRNNTLFSSWSSTPGKNGANDNMNAEKYNTTFDVYQTLTDLPNGRYLVKAQGFYRAGGQGTTNSAENAFLYANDNSTALEDINTAAQSASGNGFTKQAGDKYVPNSQADASAVFTAGYYDDNEVEAIVIDGTLKIGFKKEIAVGSDWTIFDNVRLYYMGTESFDATLTTVGDAAYSTMYIDFPVEIPSGVKAYYVTVNGENAKMNEIEGVIPAKCGVVLKAEEAGKVTFTQTSTAATTDVSGNALIGFVVDTEVNNGKAHYAFSYKDDEVGFYVPETAETATDPTSKFTAQANKAYIEKEVSASAKLNIVWDDEATGINTIIGTADKDNLYNINGSRVNNNYKGIVLKGGKKFLQK